jgi:EamA domain-containing membrane protein RarD
MSGQRFIRHLILPSIAPATLICLYFTPKTVFGCANRGYLALAVVLLGIIAAVPTAMMGAAAKKRGANEEANWWTVTTLILVSPLVLLVGPLG